MTWQAAHLRLMSTLQVRTIPAKAAREYGESVPNSRAVEIKGKRFDTIRAARDYHNISSDTFYRWLRDGKARYIESATEGEE